MATEAAARLGRRLREIRVANGLTQPQFGRLLGVSSPLISSWEHGHTVPSARRLREIATSLARITDEAGSDQELERELLRLHTDASPNAARADRTTGAGADPWRFSGNHGVTIVCGFLNDELRRKMPYTDINDPDYVRLYNYADLDSLLEVHGHIRAFNPGLEVQLKAAPEMTEQDYTSHLIVIGGVDFNEATRKLQQKLHPPMIQRSFFEDPQAAFDLLDNGRVVRRFGATLREGARPGGKGVLVEDVGNFMHGPNPYNRIHTTFTICNGMYGRGVLGAVRALTDRYFHDRNVRYLSDHFRPGSTYSLLFAVEPFMHTVHTPDWTIRDTLVYQWSDSPPPSEA